MHIESVPVHEVFQGKTVWEGEVEVFDAVGNNRTKRVYAWSYQDDKGEHIATVLGLPPVKSALDAVRVHIVSEGKKRQGK